MEDFHESAPPDEERAQPFARVANWLRRLRNQPVITEEQLFNEKEDDEDDEEDGAAKPRRRRFRRLFSPIFKRVVDRQTVAKPETPKENLGINPSISPEILVDPLADTSSPERRLGESPQSSDQSAAEVAEENPALSTASPQQQPLELAEENLPAAERAAPQEYSVDIPHPPEEEVVLSPSAESGAPPPVPPPLHYAPNVGQSTSQTIIERQRVIQHPNQLAAAVGVGLIAENVARRAADRRERRRTDQSLKGVNAKLEHTQTDSALKERKNAQARAHTQDLLVWQRAFESRPPTKPIPPQGQRPPKLISEKTPERSKAAKAAPLPPNNETNPAQTAPARQSPSVIPKPKETAAEAETKPPESHTKPIIPEEERRAPEAAARPEQRQPDSKPRAERPERHDDGGQKPIATNLAPVGSAAAASAAASESPSLVTAPLSQPTSPQTAAATPPQVVQSAPYKQAAQSGFWAAVILLAVLAVIAALT